MTTTTTTDDEEDERDGTPRDGVLALGARDDEDEARDDDDARCGDLGWRADADADADAR